jgi:hypothetical protein
MAPNATGETRRVRGRNDEAFHINATSGAAGSPTGVEAE